MYQRWTEGSFFIWILEISTLVRVGGCWGTQGCPTWVLMCRCSGGDWRCHLALLPRRETVTSRPKGNTGMSWLQPDAKKHKFWGLGTSWLGSAFQGNLVLSPVVTHHHQVQGSNMKFWPVNWSTRPDLSGTSVLVSSVYRLWNYAQNFAELL